MAKAEAKAGVTVERIVAELPRSPSATSTGLPSYQQALCSRRPRPGVDARHRVVTPQPPRRVAKSAVMRLTLSEPPVVRALTKHCDAVEKALASQDLAKASMEGKTGPSAVNRRIFSPRANLTLPGKFRRIYDYEPKGEV